MALKKGGAKVQKSAKAEAFQTVKGMSDILPRDEEWWKLIERAGTSLAELHDFRFIETPVLEYAGLFERGVGGDTDIVEKQMYVLKTKGGDRLALRPEGTASVMRSYLEHHLGYFASPLKVYYFGPMFRHERPQAGRERQFHQWGFEILGDNDPFYDGEMIVATLDFLRALKLKDVKVRINTIGCRVCRPTYREKLRQFYSREKSNVCRDCERRFDKNPLRLLDCEEENCKTVKSKAPIILDYLCQNCNNHFKTVLEFVEDNGILYEPDPYLVRGLDYYNRTVFECYVPELPSALAGGGRYDYLAELLGGRQVPGVGSAIGIERVISAMRAQGIAPHPRKKPSVFFVAVGEQAKKASLRLIEELRMSGIVVYEAVGKKSLRAQLKAAGKCGAPLSLLYGQKEVFEKTVIVRDMESGAQEMALTEKLVEEVKKRL